MMTRDEQDKIGGALIREWRESKEMLAFLTIKASQQGQIAFGSGAASLRCGLRRIEPGEVPERGRRRRSAEGDQGRDGSRGPPSPSDFVGCSQTCPRIEVEGRVPA